MIARYFLLFFFVVCLTQCQAWEEEKPSQLSYQRSNYVLRRGIYPEKMLEPELKPYLKDILGSGKALSGKDPFSRLRRVELVDQLPREGIVASCDSYEILARDKIEDNLLKGKEQWYELKLLESAFSSEVRIRERLRSLIQSCVKGENEDYLSSLPSLGERK